MGDASSPPRTSSKRTSGVLAPRRTPIRILTHNIRFATDTPEESEKLWPDRFPYLSSHFKYHTRPQFAPQATLVCMQEVLHEQLLDLHSKTLNTLTGPSSNEDINHGNDWDYVGVGRDDGKTKGEYSPIFFRTSAWECLHFETIWLNETGEVGKKGWDAGSIRILTCAILKPVITSDTSVTGQQSSSKLVLAMNTHLDNDGATSRRESAKVIIQVASRLQTEYSPAFTFLTGDLNSNPEDGAYKILNQPGSGFVDTRRLLDNDKDHPNHDGKFYAFGNELTFTGFPAEPSATGKERIDFVHLGTGGGEGEAESLENLGEMVQGYAVLPNRFDDRVWLSDHRAVVVDLLVPL